MAGLNEPKTATVEKASPHVVAIILNWNDPETTLSCIASMQTCAYPALELIVVDNASDDDSVTRIRAAYPNITVLISPINGGYSSGNNVGIEYALRRGAQYVLFLNNDVIANELPLGAMVDLAFSDSRIGMVTCLILYDDGRSRPYYADGAFSTLLCTGVNVPRTRRHRHESPDPRDVSFVNGAFFLVRCGVFETLGLMDERFFLYDDDVELSNRVGQSFRMVYMPSIVVTHKCGAGKGWKNYTIPYLYYSTRNRLWLLQHGNIFYYGYAVIFSLTNVLVKSFFYASLRLSGDVGANPRIRSMWSGFWDGVSRKIPPVGTRISEPGRYWEIRKNLQF